MRDLLFLGGPSGVGKSTFGEILQRNYGYTHYEFDNRGSEIDLVRGCGLRDEWDLLCRSGNLVPFAAFIKHCRIIE